MKRFWQRRSWSVFQRILIYGAAAVLALLALRWLFIFGVSDYRSHRRPVMIPLAIVTLLLALGLLRLSSAAIALLVVLATLVAAGALYIQVAGAFLQPFLSALVAGSLLCLCALVPPLIKI